VYAKIITKHAKFCDYEYKPIKMMEKTYEKTVVAKGPEYKRNPIGTFL